MHAFLYSSLSVNPSLHTKIVIPETSLGIDDIREAQKFLSILPPRGKINKLVIFQAEKMTLAAQNAFLKTLEEPPVQTEIYLVTTKPDQLLPTILSRVEIVKDTDKFTYHSDTLENSRKLWQKLQNSGVGECLAVIDENKFDRDSFLHFLDDLEFIIHQNLFALNPHIYTVITKTRRYLQSNCNLRLVMDYFASSLVIQ